MNHYKVLIAEDEDLIARDIAARLEALGHTVVATVSTAKEAIEHASSAQVVLMNIRLDGPVDGIEAACKIRERYRLPVLFLTAQADSSTLERAKLAEPFGYIVKPAAHASLHPSIEIAMHRHQIELRMEEREALLRATLESVQDAIIVTDIEGQIRMLNPAAEGLGGRSAGAISQLLPEDPVSVAILRDTSVPIYTRLTEQWVEGSAAPLKASGKIIGGVVTLRDVTARRREEQRLRQLEKATTVACLAAGMADDFANLVAVIRNRSQQLLRQFEDYSPVCSAIEEIQQAAAAADKITRRLADLGARPIDHLQALSLNGILRRMSKIIQSIAGDQVAVTIRLGASVGRVYADPLHTEELITQLVLHTVKAMPEGGQLTVETTVSGDHASLSVTHTGGLRESAAFDLAFQRYWTTDSNRLEAFFPRWTEPEPAAGEPPTLLLIDPRENIRALLHNFFEANGFNLLEAADDDQANVLLDLHEVALIIGGSSKWDAVPVLRLSPPYTQQQLLNQVRELLSPARSSSAFVEPEG